MSEPPEDRSFLDWLRRRRSSPAPAAGVKSPPSAPSRSGAPPARPPQEPGPGRESAARREEIVRVQALTASLLTKKVSPRQLFRHIVDGAADCLNAHETSLMLVEGDELRVVSARQAREHVTMRLHRQRIGEGVAGWVAREGKPVLLNEGDDLSRFAKLAPKGGRIRSSLSVPLEVEGRVVGVLNANRLAGGEKFTAEDLAVLRLFADTAALAIDQTSLLETVQTRARSLQTLLGVTEAFGDKTEPEAALVKLMPGLGETFQPSCALAFFGTAESGRFRAVASWRAAKGARGPEGLDGLALSLNAGISQAFENREPTWIENLPIEGTAVLDTLLPSRLLFVPVGALSALSRCALILGWEDPGYTLPPEDLRVLEGLARQLELALSSQDRAAAVGALEAEMAQARAHLMEAERLASVGQSMAGVVHDINAPLTAVTAFAQLIQKESTEAKTRERAGHIVEAAQRAQRLVRELLTLARPHPPTFELVDIHKLIQAAMDLERPQCGVAGVRLATVFDSTLPQIKADPHRLGQVFINLLVNARQAMDAAGKGNTLTVQTRQREKTAEIQFIDNGPGIPPAVKAKIFDWFFTTKPPGEGTGLGLAVSREIVVVHGGTMRVEDTPGGGATFLLELPLSDETGAAAS